LLQSELNFSSLFIKKVGYFMISPYRANYKVTQPFGENGHRGIDLSAAFGVGDMTIVAVQKWQMY
jgi:hypothetical protein